MNEKQAETLARQFVTRLMGRELRMLKEDIGVNSFYRAQR